ncbi:MAG TPA: hypothetical protein PK280_04920 [Planctomycetota bacterium]|nr:hypothetical protein [Planctomycetota bacterium]
MSERAPSGNSQILVTLEDDGFVESPQTEDRLKRVVSRIAPGLVYPELLSHIVRHRLSVIDGHALAAAVGESEEDVFAAMRYWASAGILRKVGTHPYCYAPDQRDEQDVAFLLEAWHDSRRHARVLGFILAAHQ